MVTITLHAGQYSLLASHTVNGLTTPPTFLKANFAYNKYLVPEPISLLLLRSLNQVTKYIDDNFVAGSNFRYEQVISGNGPLTFKTVANHV